MTLTALLKRVCDMKEGIRRSGTAADLEALGREADALARIAQLAGAEFAVAYAIDEAARWLGRGGECEDGDYMVAYHCSLAALEIARGALAQALGDSSAPKLAPVR